MFYNIYFFVFFEKTPFFFGNKFFFSKKSLYLHPHKSYMKTFF